MDHYNEALDDEVKSWQATTFGPSDGFSAAKLMAVMAPVMVAIHELSFKYGHEIIRFLVSLPW